jgi:polysaccharide export outer membrane protein
MTRTAIFTVCLLLPLLSAIAQVEEYVLQPGDVISVQVVEHPEFSGQHKIRPDGRINYPVIGEVEVASLTPAQLVKIMQGKLASYVNNPVVSVSIESYYANKIYLIGAVRKSGQFEIYEPVDLIKALAMAGGLQNERVRMVKIIRADGTTIDVITKNIYDGGEKGKYLLYPGDTLYVPESVKIPWSLMNTILTALSTTVTIILGINTLSRM